MWGVNKVYYGSTLVFGKQVYENIFTANRTVTFPASMFSLKVIVVGSGGSGGNYGVVDHPIYVGDIPYSVKPDTYKTMERLSETISVKMIYYTKTKTGLTIEIED